MTVLRERMTALRQAALATSVLIPLTCYAAQPASAATISLGAAANYAVLYEGTGGHNLGISNDTVSGNIGVGGTGHVQFTGPGTINGSLNFVAAPTGQFSNSNASNVGPTSVTYGDTAVPSVSSALSAIATLTAAVSGGTNFALTNAGATVNENTGALQTINGVVSRVFNVTAYSANNSTVLTIVGDGSGQPVVFNFAQGAGNFGNNNVNLGGTVVLSGTGLTSADQVLFNFQSSGKNISLTNNGGTFLGIILAVDDAMSLTDANLTGRFFGGDSSDMHIQSGGNVFAPITGGGGQGGETPLPAALPLFATGLGALGLLSWRRKRKNAAT